MKELLLTPRGTRLIRQVDQARRREYLVLRAASFEHGRLALDTVSRWRRILHPRLVFLLVAIVLPGVGQVLNRQPMRGLMMLFFMLARYPIAAVHVLGVTQPGRSGAPGVVFRWVFLAELLRHQAVVNQLAHPDTGSHCETAEC